MKKIVLFVCTISGLSVAALGQNVAINATGAAPDPSAALDISATNLGLLAPRVADTNAVTTPAQGLIIYDNLHTCYRFRTNTKWSQCLDAVTSLSMNAAGDLIFTNELGTANTIDLPVTSLAANATGDLVFTNELGVSNTINIVSRMTHNSGSWNNGGGALVGVPEGVMVNAQQFINCGAGGTEIVLFYIQNDLLYIVNEAETDPGAVLGIWTGSGTLTLSCTIAVNACGAHPLGTYTITLNPATNTLTYTNNIAGFNNGFFMSAYY